MFPQITVHEMTFLTLASLFGGSHPPPKGPYEKEDQFLGGLQFQPVSAINTSAQIGQLCSNLMIKTTMQGQKDIHVFKKGKETFRTGEDW